MNNRLAEERGLAPSVLQISAASQCVEHSAPTDAAAGNQSEATSNAAVGDQSEVLKPETAASAEAAADDTWDPSIRLSNLFTRFVALPHSDGQFLNFFPRFPFSLKSAGV